MDMHNRTNIFNMASRTLIISRVGIISSCVAVAVGISVFWSQYIALERCWIGPWRQQPWPGRSIRCSAGGTGSNLAASVPAPALICSSHWEGKSPEERKWKCQCAMACDLRLPAAVSLSRQKFVLCKELGSSQKDSSGCSVDSNEAFVTTLAPSLLWGICSLKK